MSVLYLNGSQYPQFVLYTSGGSTTYSLSLTQELTEQWTQHNINHELIDVNSDIRKLKRVQNKGEWTGKFYLDYSGYISKSDFETIKTILDGADERTDLWLIPRSDLARRRFKVLYVSNSLNINILKGGYTAIGNKSITLEFDTVDSFSMLPLDDPDDIPITALINSQAIFYIAKVV